MSVKLNIPAKVESVDDIRKIREELVKAERELTTPKPGMKKGDFFISINQGQPVREGAIYFIGLVTDITFEAGRAKFKFTYVGGPGYDSYVGLTSSWIDGYKDYTVVKGVVGWAAKV